MGRRSAQWVRIWAPGPLVTTGDTPYRPHTSSGTGPGGNPHVAEHPGEDAQALRGHGREGSRPDGLRVSGDHPGGRCHHRGDGRYGDRTGHRGPHHDGDRGPHRWSLTSRKANDRGQVFPLYALVVVGLLFAALAFFVFGQAAVVRSDAQGAADAAALAAAREARDNLLPGLDLATLKPEDWQDVLEGKSFAEGACGAAEEFARLNDATGTCTRSLLRFSVEVTTNGTVGDSVVPGTRDMHGKARAVAEVVPRCELGPAPIPSATPTPAPTGPPSPGPVVITCKGGKTVRFDPLKPDPWSTLARRLFDVRLAS